MQLHSFILHSLLCYYNDGEVVKKNMSHQRGKSINSSKRVINIAYACEVRDKKRAGFCPALLREAWCKYYIITALHRR
jgi:hypothetical protein